MRIKTVQIYKYVQNMFTADERIIQEEKLLITEIPDPVRALVPNYMGTIVDIFA